MGLFSCLQQQQRWKPSSDNIVVVVLPFLFSFSWIQKNTFLFNEQEIPLGNFPGEGLQIKQAVLSIVKLFWEILIACLLYIFCLLLKYLLRRFDQKRQNVRFEAENKSADVKDHSFRRLKENEKFLLSILSGFIVWIVAVVLAFMFTVLLSDLQTAARTPRPGMSWRRWEYTCASSSSGWISTCGKGKWQQIDVLFRASLKENEAFSCFFSDREKKRGIYLLNLRETTHC